ncbi:MAG: WxcM-like domain-containing protein [Methylococcales bacterium]|nr:WxcM-like domain-containing protein [Methylococcales bacterium]
MVIHEKALVEEGASIGKNTRVAAFAHILSKAYIGSDCDICDYVFIENNVQIGNRVTIKCGVQLWDGLRIEDDVFIDSNVTFTNDRSQRDGICSENVACTLIAKGAFIGANATISANITVGGNAIIEAGSVVTRSVPHNAIVTGNPAKIIGYVDAKNGKGTSTEKSHHQDQSKVSTTVAGVTLHTFRAVPDMRGSLSVGEFEREIPFKPLRYFLVFDVPTTETRGEHAHIKCQQFLIAVKGSVRVVADDGRKREEFLLDRNNIGLYLPAMTWGIQYHYSSDAVLLVFASEYYDSSDYIRDYSEFETLVKRNA